MHHHRSRLVQHARTGGAHREGEIGVFVVGRRVARIEAAQRFEQRARECDRRAAAVVGIAHIREPAIVRRFVAAVVPAGTIGEHHPAGLLQAAVGIDQPGADQADLRMLSESVEHRVQPAGLRHGVVVEEDDEIAARQLRAVVAGGNEPAVGSAREQADAVDLRELRHAVVL